MLLLIAKLVLLYFCLAYLRKSRTPLAVALFYSAVSLIMALAITPADRIVFSESGYLALLIGFFFDFGVAVAVFSLTLRYQARVKVFFGIIFFGVVVNSVGQYWLLKVMETDYLVELAAGPRESTHMTFPPQLWSHHKALDVSAETCAGRALVALNANDFTSVARNDTYTYGNSGSNRAAVKCVEQGTNSSFVYIAVAGPDKAVVENLRNRLARSL